MALCLCRNLLAALCVGTPQYLCEAVFMLVLPSSLLTLLVVIRTNVPAPPLRHAPAAATPGVARSCGGFCVMARATKA